MPNYKTGGDLISGDRFGDDEGNAVKNHFYGASEPANAVAGVIWVDSGDDRVYRFDGTNWVVLGPPIDDNWTPTITFGGGEAGPITYNAGQTLGRYSLKGNWCFFSGRIVLTSKGTSNGNALIESLPFTSRDYEGSHSACPLFANKVRFENILQSFITPNTNEINIYELTEGGVLTNITDAEFEDDSGLIFSGMYEVEV